MANTDKVVSSSSSSSFISSSSSSSSSSSAALCIRVAFRRISRFWKLFRSFYDFSSFDSLEENDEQTFREILSHLNLSFSAASDEFTEEEGKKKKEKVKDNINNKNEEEKEAATRKLKHCLCNVSSSSICSLCISSSSSSSSSIISFSSSHPYPHSFTTSLANLINELQDVRDVLLFLSGKYSDYKFPCRSFKSADLLYSSSSSVSQFSSSLLLPSSSLSSSSSLQPSSLSDIAATCSSFSSSSSSFCSSSSSLVSKTSSSSLCVLSSSSLSSTISPISFLSSSSPSSPPSFHSICSSFSHLPRCISSFEVNQIVRHLTSDVSTSYQSPKFDLFSTTPQCLSTFNSPPYSSSSSSSSSSSFLSLLAAPSSPGSSSDTYKKKLPRHYYSNTDEDLVDEWDPSDEYRDDEDPGYRVRDLWEVELITEISMRREHPSVCHVPFVAAFNVDESIASSPIGREERKSEEEDESFRNYKKKEGEDGLKPNSTGVVEMLSSFSSVSSSSSSFSTAGIRGGGGGGEEEEKKTIISKPSTYHNHINRFSSSAISAHFFSPSYHQEMTSTAHISRINTTHSSVSDNLPSSVSGNLNRSVSPEFGIVAPTSSSSFSEGEDGAAALVFPWETSVGNERTGGIGSSSSSGDAGRIEEEEEKEEEDERNNQFLIYKKTRDKTKTDEKENDNISLRREESSRSDDSGTNSEKSEKRKDDYHSFSESQFGRSSICKNKTEKDEDKESKITWRSSGRFGCDLIDLDSSSVVEKSSSSFTLIPSPQPPQSLDTDELMSVTTTSMGEVLFENSGNQNSFDRNEEGGPVIFNSSRCSSISSPSPSSSSSSSFSPSSSSSASSSSSSSWVNALSSVFSFISHSSDSSSSSLSPSPSVGGSNKNANNEQTPTNSFSHTVRKSTKSNISAADCSFASTEGEEGEGKKIEVGGDEEGRGRRICPQYSESSSSSTVVSSSLSATAAAAARWRLTYADGDMNIFREKMRRLKNLSDSSLDYCHPPSGDPLYPLLSVASPIPSSSVCESSSSKITSNDTQFSPELFYKGGGEIDAAAAATTIGSPISRKEKEDVEFTDHINDGNHLFRNDSNDLMKKKFQSYSKKGEICTTNTYDDGGGISSKTESGGSNNNTEEEDGVRTPRKVVFDCFNLKVIYERGRTGFELYKELLLPPNTIIAGRYAVEHQLGQAAFSRALQCRDLLTNQLLCMKVIKNDKDYLDQSLDEVKLLRLVNYNGDPDGLFCLKLYDYFYYKEHLFIITELLKDNLYEHSKKVRFEKIMRGEESSGYFTLGHLQKITFQVLTALQFIHSLHLIHCDLKPENILLQDEHTYHVKVIDFGSSCFDDDSLSTYVQSRSYRAPEVLLGLPYDQKIDMWSLGCILAELWTGYVLFQNDSVQSLLARIVGIIGKLPYYLVKRGTANSKLFTFDGQLCQLLHDQPRCPIRGRRFRVLLPKPSSLYQRLRTSDHVFVNFLQTLLYVDPCRRPTAAEALAHPWLKRGRYIDGLQ